MRIAVDYNKCTGLGMCEAEAPELFEVGDDGRLVVLDERPPDERHCLLQAAVEACPTEALSIVD